MTFYELVYNLNLGSWHELVSMYMSTSAPISIPWLQSELELPATVMHRVVLDFSELGLCFIEKKNTDLVHIKKEYILERLAQMVDSRTAKRITTQTLASTPEMSQLRPPLQGESKRLPQNR